MAGDDSTIGAVARSSDRDEWWATASVGGDRASDVVRDSTIGGDLDA